MLASNGRDEQDFYLAIKLLLLRMRFHAKPCMYVSLNISNAVQFADKRFLCVSFVSSSARCYIPSDGYKSQIRQMY